MQLKKLKKRLSERRQYKNYERHCRREDGTQATQPKDDVREVDIPVLRRLFDRDTLPSLNPIVVAGMMHLRKQRQPFIDWYD